MHNTHTHTHTHTHTQTQQTNVLEAALHQDAPHRTALALFQTATSSPTYMYITGFIYQNGQWMGGGGE